MIRSRGVKEKRALVPVEVMTVQSFCNCCCCSFFVSFFFFFWSGVFREINFLKKFSLFQILCRWLLTVRKNYRNVIYHNWRHAFNVAQSMFCMLTVG